MQIAAAIPMVSQNKAETKDRSDSGALVKAISRPVTMTKASENATRMYAGAWIQTWIEFGGEL